MTVRHWRCVRCNRSFVHPTLPACPCGGYVVEAL